MFNLQQYVDDYVRVLRHLDGATIERMAEILVGAWTANRTVFFCGNGGSAANASHIAADLTKLTAPAHGPRLRAVSLTESGAAISAIANDVAYEEIFAEQLRAYCAPNDVVVGLSTSGSSLNVLRAVEYANAAGATTLGITGRGGSPLQQIAKHTLTVDSMSVQQIEDATMVVGHVLCLRVKHALQLQLLQTRLRPGANPPATLPARLSARAINP